MKIYLIGLPGSGKSTVGKSLSNLLHLPFIDLDEEIQKTEGHTIKQLFSQEGEGYFRKVESKLLQELSATKKFIMATGGGAPCFHDGIEYMNQTGITVFLDIPVETISQRLDSIQQSERPLLKSDDLISKLIELRAERLKFYSKATVCLQEDSITAEKIIEALGLKR